LPIVKKVKRDIYVDNMITGVDTLSEAKDLNVESKSLFTSASMNLREWASNSTDFMDFVPRENQAGKSEHKVLGINWNVIMILSQCLDLLSMMLVVFGPREKCNFFSARPSWLFFCPHCS